MLLVEHAPIVGVDGTLRLSQQLEAQIDPDGVKPREDELRAARALKTGQDAAGMVTFAERSTRRLARHQLAIETLVGAELHAARDARRGFGAGRAGDG